jgi:hypothetical protein
LELNRKPHTCFGSVKGKITLIITLVLMLAGKEFKWGTKDVVIIIVKFIRKEI